MKKKNEITEWKDLMEMLWEYIEKQPEAVRKTHLDELFRAFILLSDDEDRWIRYFFVCANLSDKLKASVLADMFKEFDWRELEELLEYGRNHFSKK